MNEYQDSCFQRAGRGLIERRAGCFSRREEPPAPASQAHARRSRPAEGQLTGGARSTARRAQPPTFYAGALQFRPPRALPRRLMMMWARLAMAHDDDTDYSKYDVRVPWASICIR